MKIAFLTDIHFDERQVSDYGVSQKSNWERILQSVKKDNPDLVVFGGDIGAASSHHYFAQTMEPFDVRLVLGNHDHYGDVVDNLPQLRRGRSSQSFTETIGKRKCLFLDSSTGSLDSRQMGLLEKTLGETKELILFIHHPIFPVAGYVDTHYALKGRNEIARAIHESDCGVTIFCGHYHFADVRRSGKITQYITPAASYQIAKGTDKLIPDPTHFGYRIIELGDDIQTHCVIFDQ